MGNEKVLNTDVNRQVVNHRLNFMFKKISVSKMSLVYWLTLPEFEAEMLAKLDNKEAIDDRVVCESMKRIYAKWERLRDNSNEKPDFNYSLARRGINQIEKSISDNKQEN